MKVGFLASKCLIAHHIVFMGHFVLTPSLDLFVLEKKRLFVWGCSPRRVWRPSSCRPCPSATTRSDLCRRLPRRRGYSGTPARGKVQRVLQPPYTDSNACAEGHHLTSFWALPPPPPSLDCCLLSMSVSCAQGTPVHGGRVWDAHAARSVQRARLRGGHRRRAAPVRRGQRAPLGPPRGRLQRRREAPRLEHREEGVAPGERKRAPQSVKGGWVSPLSPRPRDKGRGIFSCPPPP